jgi:hypothetical protein
MAEVEEEMAEDKQMEEENVEQPEVTSTENGYRLEAQSGEGLTHLARRALRERGVEELSAEQKVFAEDYIQKNMNHSGWLQLGEEVEIPESLLEEAVEEAENLSESQIENLTQYTQSVA